MSDLNDTAPDDGFDEVPEDQTPEVEQGEGDGAVDAEVEVAAETELKDAKPTADFESFISCFTSLTERTDAAKDSRGKAWRAADPNGNGYCSLAEIDSWVKEHLLDSNAEDGERLWQAFRPCYIRAFKDAADAMADKRINDMATATTDDFVQRPEFRLFVSYLCIYARMFDAFAMIDGGSDGTTAADDRRMSMQEWKDGLAKVSGHGFVALPGSLTLNEEEAEEVFEEMDADGKGMVLLGEWCSFLKAKEQEAGTEVGALLSAGDEDEGEATESTAPAGADVDTAGEVETTTEAEAEAEAEVEPEEGDEPEQEVQKEEAQEEAATTAATGVGEPVETDKATVEGEAAIEQWYTEAEENKPAKTEVEAEEALVEEVVDEVVEEAVIEATPEPEPAQAEEPKPATPIRKKSAVNKPKPKPKPKPVARPTTSSGGNSVFDRLSSQYTGTSKYRRGIAENKGGRSRGMDGNTGRSHGTGSGHGSSWLDAGMSDVDFGAQDRHSIGSSVRGGAGSMGKSTTRRFQRQTANGHFCSTADAAEARSRDISFANSSSFTKSAMSKSMFGSSEGMGMGGNPRNSRFRARSSSGHYLSKRDQEEAAKRDLSNASADVGSCRSSFSRATKSLGASSRPGMGMGGSSSRFRNRTASGHYVSKADMQEAIMRDHSGSTSLGVSASTSSFSSAMKKGNPRYSVMGGTTSRFAGSGSMYRKNSASDVGPGSYSKSTTNHDQLPMPAVPLKP